ncbi:DUF3397 domain-containing protein [Halalkalibacter lacteus]|uniref:DUF3397 domain-containing protein n=1 Tax=Halalkalibacter lacteus TaxID=3090663 RepID=UPI002FC742FE
MSEVVAWVIATIVTIPLLGWYIIYIFSAKMSKNKSKSIQRASDWTTVLFMIAVNFIIVELWAKSFLWVILAVFFFVALIFTFIHWRLAGDIHVGKLFKGIWRFNFLLFFMTYLFLSGFGLLLRILS